MKKKYGAKLIIVLSVVVALVIVGMSGSQTPNKEKLTAEEANRELHRLALNTKKELRDIAPPVSYETYLSRRPTLEYHFAACFSEEKLSCAEGLCEDLEPVTFWLLSGGVKDSKLFRCDNLGCDTYETTHQTSGLFENIQPREPVGFLFKRQVLDEFGNPVDEGAFIDVATFGTGAVVSTGYCIETLYSQ